MSTLEKTTSKKVFSLIFTLLMIFLMTKVGLKELMLLSNNPFNLLKNSVIMLCILLILFFVFLIRFLPGNFIRTKPFFLAFLLISSLLMAYLLNYKEGYILNNQITPLFLTYAVLFFLLISLMLNKQNILDKSVVVNTLLFISVCQSVFGIIQYVLKDTIISVIGKDGKPVVNPIYYWKGISSTNPEILQRIGGKVRAFGLTDSGLTLGLFALLGISLVIDSKKLSISSKTVLLIILITALMMTITRIIWLAFVLLLILYFFVKRRKWLSWFYYSLFGLQFIFIMIAVVVDKFTWISKFFPTILSRFSGYNYFIKFYPFKVSSILWGHNIVSFIDSFKTTYSIDNEMLNIFLDIGIIGYFIFFSTITLALMKWLKNADQKRSATLNFLIICPFIGIGNVIFYFYLPVLLLFSLSCDVLPSNRDVILE